MSNVEIVTASALCLLSLSNYVRVLNSYVIQKKKTRQQRRWWVTSIYRNRPFNSVEDFFKEMTCEQSGEFNIFCRMSPVDFQYLLDKIEPMIKKQTKLRIPISPKVRLALTLRYLATGDSYRTLQNLFKVSTSAISTIVPEVCRAINFVLRDQIKLPETPDEWLPIVEGFKGIFPRCAGVIDGKHIIVQCPAQSGSKYYNHKSTYTLTLMTLLDSDYRFIFADIGGQGRIDDEGNFQNCLLWQKIETDTINLPSDTPLPGNEKNVPYIFLGDETFALHKNLMTCYPGNHDIGTKERAFNDRLSNSRAIAENVFGLLSTVFRVFKKPIDIDIKKAQILTMTCILLHNFLRNECRNIYTPPGTFDSTVDGVLAEGAWRKHHIDYSVAAIRPITPVDTEAPLHAAEIRSEYADFFNNLN